MSRFRHNELEWHRENIKRITRNTRIACDRVAALDPHRRAARAHEKRAQEKFNSILNLVILGAALITLFSAGGVGRAFAMVMGS